MLSERANLRPSRKGAGVLIKSRYWLRGPDVRLLGETKAFPSQMRYIISPACSGSTPESSIGWMCSENLQRCQGGSWSDVEPPQLAPEGAVGAALLGDVWAPHPGSEAEHTLQRKLSSAMKWGLERRSQLPLNHNSPVQCEHYAPIRLLNSLSISPSLVRSRDTWTLSLGSAFQMKR